MSSRKVLIIKLGYSETLDKEVSENTSLGDVLRSTVLLHLYKDDRVTWLTDAKAVPLLYKNPYIDNILPFNLTSVLQLEVEHFDVVVNLEKVPGICALTDRIQAWQKYGYRFNAQTGQAEAYKNSENALKISTDEEVKRAHGKTWQENLYEMVDSRWSDESYILGYEPKPTESFDVGFNIEVGNKFATKAWPMDHWKSLEASLVGWKVSYQQGKKDLYRYMDWISSCRVLISNDSLGLHLAYALKIEAIGLFGPTSAFEVHPYGRGEILEAPKEDFSCMPCYAPSCANDKFCMESISVDRVKASVIRLLEKQREEP